MNSDAEHPPETLTPRQRIMAELEKGPMTARDLSQIIHIPEKEVIAHLEHVAKSLRRPRRLIIHPPVCHRCGYDFPDRRRFSIPGKCPQCRHEGIAPPAFQIPSP